MNETIMNQLETLLKSATSVIPETLEQVLRWEMIKGTFWVVLLTVLTFFLVYCVVYVFKNKERIDARYGDEAAEYTCVMLAILIGLSSVGLLMYLHNILYIWAAPKAWLLNYFIK